MSVTRHRLSTPLSSPASSDRPRNDTDGVEMEDFGLEFDPPSPSSNAGSANPPAPPITGVAEPAASSVVWHLSHSDGRQEGPLLREEIRSRLANGTLSFETLIWRPGMPKWEPVNSVPEFQNSVLPHANARLNPDSLEFIGTVSAVIALAIFVVSAIGGYWGYSWFTGALLFLLASFVGEGLAGVLAAIGRIESQIRTLEKGPHSHD